VQVIIILVAEYLISLGTGVILLDCEDLYLHDIFVNSFLCYMLHNILIFCFSSLDLLLLNFGPHVLEMVYTSFEQSVGV
jgi:hypothetical protein